jgi:hypothetical protein
VAAVPAYPRSRGRRAGRRLSRERQNKSDFICVILFVLIGEAPGFRASRLPPRGRKSSGRWQPDFCNVFPAPACCFHKNRIEETNGHTKKTGDCPRFFSQGDSRAEKNIPRQISGIDACRGHG